MDEDKISTKDIPSYHWPTKEEGKAQYPKISVDSARLDHDTEALESALEVLRELGVLSLAFFLRRPVIAGDVLRRDLVLVHES